ncbi:predicted protein [Nematostella vectensis]|uniref:Uncharacterized protein n=1 Tax=Nematostella vectensis TaxID=45351 RepID=A7RLW9_NEMVE|nr:trichohyalin [Nematostella vectensis]EDO47494.1 predicted protein [Nematostella vectensis]|eukprot:XP_001639557.1 predicted protein [Nematostella vectensis]
MGLKGKSFLARSREKKREKLEKFQAKEESLLQDIQAAEKREEERREKRQGAERRLHNSTRAANILRDRLRIRQERLALVHQQRATAEARLQILRHDKLVNDEACNNLEISHKQEPERRRKLQVELYRVIRDNERIKEETAFIYSKVEERFDELREKLKVLRSRERAIVENEKIVNEYQLKIHRQLEQRKSEEYHKQRMKEFIVYVMKMNLHAALSRKHMVERRGQHLVQMIQNFVNELERTTFRLSELKKQKCETRPLRKLQKKLRFAEIDCGSV